MNLLLINFFAYLIWLLITIKKEKRLTSYSLLIAMYTVIAFLGYYTVKTGIYYNTFGYYSPNTLQAEPYIYAFIGYFILFLPFYKIRSNIDKVSFIFNKDTKVFVNFWIIIYILYTILKLSEAVIAVSTGLADMYEARHIEGVQLFTYDPIIDKFNGYSSFFLTASTPFMMLYSLLGIANKKVTTFKGVLIICLCFLPELFGDIGMGSRGAMFMTLLCFLFFVFLFAKQLPRRFIKNIFIIIVSFAVVVLVYSWAITVGRMGSSGGMESIFRYFGESFPNLGWTIWGNATYHPMGERFFPTLWGNKLVTSMSVDEAYQYWSTMTGVPVLNFKTYYGDLYVEFGEYGAFVFLMLTSIPIYLYFKRKGVTIFNFSYLYLYFQLCVFAFSGYTKTDWGFIFQLIITTSFVVFLKWMYRKRGRINA